MKIVIDEREATLYDKCISIVEADASLSNTGKIQLIKRVIPLGDILIETDAGQLLAIIERKSLADLLSSIKDGRYDEQSHRLLHAGEVHPHNVIYLIEGILSQLRSPGEKKLVYSAATSIQFFKGFSVFRTASMQETAEWILAMASKIDRDLAKGKVAAYKIKTSNNEEEGDQVNESEIQSYSKFVKKVKRDNITPENMGEIMLTQIPGISSVTAVAIMKHFPTFPKLLTELAANKNCLDHVKIETRGVGKDKDKERKINKTAIENIIRYLAI